MSVLKTISEHDLEEQVMNTLDHLSDRIIDCSNNEAAGAVLSHLEHNYPDNKYTLARVKQVLDECWF